MTFQNHRVRATSLFCGFPFEYENSNARIPTQRGVLMSKAKKMSYKNDIRFQVVIINPITLEKHDEIIELYT